MNAEAAPDGLPAEKSGKNLRGAVLWTAGIFAALGLAWFIGAVAVPFWQTRALLSKSFTRAGSPMEHPRVLIGKLGGPERAPARLRLYLRMPKCVAPDKWCAKALLGFWVDPAAVRQFAADATDGRHDYRELARRGQGLFSQGFIPDHAALLQGFPCVQRDGLLVYRLQWSTSGGKGPPGIILHIDSKHGEIVGVYLMAIGRLEKAGESCEPPEPLPASPQ